MTTNPLPRRGRPAAQIALIALLLIATASGCSISYTPIEVLSVGGLSLSLQDKSSIHITVPLRVHNPNSYAIELKEASLTAYLHARPIGTILLADDVAPRLEPTTTIWVRIPLTLKLHDQADELPLLFAGASLIERIDIEGNVKVKAKGHTIKRKIERTPLAEFIQNVGQNVSIRETHP